MPSPDRQLAASTVQDGPVKIVMERRVRPDAQARFDAWVKRLIGAACQLGGVEGSSVLRSGTTGDHFVLLRFVSHTHLRRWQESSEFAALLKEADTHSISVEPSQVKTGLETWFTLPGVPAPRTAPPKWKMALVTWLALLPQIIILAFVLPPLQLSFLTGTVLSTTIPVAMLTWVVMPSLTRLLYGWLYAEPAPARTQST